MRISHPCLDCGADLRRERVGRDRPGDLPIVVCPRCGRACVRRTQLMAARRRESVRLGKTLLALGLQLGALVFFVATVAAACDPYGKDLLRGRSPETAEFLLIGAIAVALGAWLTAGLAHWARWAAWAAFTGVVAGIMAIISMLLPLIGALLTRLGLPVGGGAVRLDHWVAAVAVLTGVMVLAITGIPVGVAALAAAERVRSRSWRARRRRLHARSLRP